MSPGPVFEPEGKGEDVWGTARALFAAGFRPGEVVHNSFSYHLTPGGFIMESGARALGCAVIPAGTGNTEQQLEAIAHFKPSGYLGTPDFLKVLLDAAAKAGKDASSLKHGLVSGAALPASLRQGIDRPRRERAAMLCHRRSRRDRVEAKRARIDRQRDALVEIVRPGTGDPVAEGEVGEVVVTAFNRIIR
jgi:phenylacetate-CoA ligase